MAMPPGRVYSRGDRVRALRLADALGSGRKAAKQLGIHYQTIYRWRGEQGRAPRMQTWRCPCDPMQLQNGSTCRACARPRLSH